MSPATKTFYIAGVKFRPIADLQRAMYLAEDKCPQPITLVGEPSNRFDPRAVKVLIGDVFIGYVPKPQNTEIWELRAKGYKPKARLVDFFPHNQTHYMFNCEVQFDLEPVQPTVNQPQRKSASNNA